MRVVNMAHGSFYLLAGYIAYEVQQRMTGAGGFAIAGSDVSTWEWVFPVIIAAAIVALIGLVVQQLLLSWNLGQDLRQALLTIAVSVIVADQVIAHFPRQEPPGRRGQRGQPHVARLDRAPHRPARLEHRLLARAPRHARARRRRRNRTLALALPDEDGKVIRAGVDDQQMTSALGINIQKTFAIAFVVGAALAALGAAVGNSRAACRRARTRSGS